MVKWAGAEIWQGTDAVLMWSRLAVVEGGDVDVGCGTGW